MKNMLSYRQNRVHYNTEETETVDRETGEVTKVANADSGVEEKKGSAIVGLMILIFMLVIFLAIIYFWYWVFKNIFLILRGK